MIPTVHLIVPSLKRRDGTGDYLLSQRDLFATAGYDTRIYAQHVHENVGESCLSYDDIPKKCASKDIIIYHYGCYDHGFDRVKEIACSVKVFYYHNQTTPIYFEEFDPGTAEALRRGLCQVAGAENYFSHFFANSPYTIRQQISRGALHRVAWNWLPPLVSDEIIFKPELFNASEKRYDIVYVSRIVPHKKLHHLIDIFKHYRNFHSEARMAVIGSGEGRYFLDCIQAIEEVGSIELFSEVTNDERSAIISNSKLLAALSAHEGFSLPVIEGMQAGCLPIYGSAEWLHTMIYRDELRVGIDGDCGYAAYKIQRVIGNSVDHIKHVCHRLDLMKALFSSDYQFKCLSGNVPRTKALDYVNRVFAV